jgi:hypothetical protein
MDNDKQQGQQSNPQDTSHKNPQSDTQNQQQGDVQPDQNDRKPGQGTTDQEQDKTKKTA